MVRFGSLLSLPFRIRTKYNPFKPSSKLDGGYAQTVYRVISVIDAARLRLWFLGIGAEVRSVTSELFFRWYCFPIKMEFGWFSVMMGLFYTGYGLRLN